MDKGVDGNLTALRLASPEKHLDQALVLTGFESGAVLILKRVGGSSLEQLSKIDLNVAESRSGDPASVLSIDFDAERWVTFEFGA